jgi:hypothetical protein
MVTLIKKEDLSDDIPDEAYGLIGRIITEWSILDHRLLEDLMAETDLEAGLAGLMIGRMDTRAKFDRLIAIDRYRTRRTTAKEMARIRARFLMLLERRNQLAHGCLFASSRSTGNFFLSFPNTLSANPMRPSCTLRAIASKGLSGCYKK